MTRRRRESRATDTAYGRIPIGLFLDLWKRADTVRFYYRPLRLVPALMLVMLGALWGYYLYSVIGGSGLSLALGIFGAVLLLLSAWTLLRLLAWRRFVRRSGVAVTPGALVWRQGTSCFLAPWSLIGPEALGLERLAFDKSYESFLNIQIGDTREPLFLVRLYARLDDIEGLLGELLQRIPREKWGRAAELAIGGVRKPAPKQEPKPKPEQD